MEAAVEFSSPALAVGGAGTAAAAVDDVEPRDGIIYISDGPDVKPYLGGFRDKRSGVEYVHALTQTPSERLSKWAGKPPRMTRETQTADMTTRSAQTTRECTTQTKRHDLYLDTTHDRVVVPRPYFTAAQLHEVKVANALRIQCQWRGFLARRRAAFIRTALAAQRAAAEEAARAAAAEAEEKRQRDIERRLHPRTMEDFAILYDEVEAWRVAETARIKHELPADEAAQRAALAELLKKETSLLATIERLRTVAAKENEADRVTSKLDKMAAPKVWETTAGEPVVVHTPFTTRATELKALFDGLAVAGLDVKDRLSLLLHVKYTVMEFDCALTREISSLIDRETDMLSRKRPEEALKGVRQRLQTLFLEFCETPAFNPEAQRFKKLPPGVTPSLKPSVLDTTPVTGLRGKKVPDATFAVTGGGGTTGGTARFAATAGTGAS